MTGASPDGARMLANRLTKNRKHLSRWLRTHDISCYRLYDADIPEYALAVDVYESDRRYVHLQEYRAPKSVDAQRAGQRLQQAVEVVSELLDVAPEQVFLKVRQQQKGCAQYEKLAARGVFHEVGENGLRFLVNFSDYLDTGLFLDHRITRGMLAEQAHGRAFLNLFAYTGSGTVYAASGGAGSTTTVDMSNTYLDWARRNMRLNGFDQPVHRYAQANCIDWLNKAVRGTQRYGLIFLDPPSFSTSKRMQGTFDVQRDHVALLHLAAALLEDDGTLIFSNNRRGFKLDQAALTGLDIKDISRATLPRDFERNPRIHVCYSIRRG